MIATVSPVSDPARIDALLAYAAELLRASGSSPRLDAELLLAHVLNKPRSYLYAWPARTLERKVQTDFLHLVQQCAEGSPVAYLTGTKEFWSLELYVERHTLVPRPETERLVELALEAIPPTAPTRVADLGTGSGAIALALASERPQAQVVATDNCPDALEVAMRNAGKLGLNNVDFRQGSWCAALQGQFDVIVSNPPYVPSGDPHLQSGSVRHEPHQALAAGTDGLDAIRVIAHQVADYLRPGAALILEHGYDQRAAVQDLLAAVGLTNVQPFRDAAGKDRVVRAIARSSNAMDST